MSDIKQCAEQVCKIAYLLQQKLELDNINLNLEMYERWGSGSDKKMNEALKDNKHSEKCRQNEQATKTAMKLAQPDIRRELATAYIFMLHRFLEKCQKAEYDTKTAQYVANQEIQYWTQYQNNEIDFINQNCYYIHYENALLEAFFGKYNEI